MINRYSLSKFNLYPAVDDYEIKRVEIEMGLDFPKVYRDLLKLTNGFETEEGISIFGTDIIIERNQTYEVSDYAQGYLAIGSNGGGKFYLMSAAEGSSQLLQVDAGVMNPEYATIVSEDFVTWINNGAINIDLLEEEEEDDDDDESINEEMCELILVHPLKGGATDLKKIQDVFNIKKGLFDLLKGSKQLPFVLMKDIPFVLAKKNLKELGELGKCLKIIKIN
ncbi:SMI1/KNR4 family protein [Solibacillus merdavium]|uniref:SMI1/KNR4 family protein n=1 Tax=Solibacillus merdavium TaxID=2762218 RepID=A0ABR8XT20_9BACL|nr:SMI1/KNR4 family protein [Solibacillus merdavium]MBD8035076.1 SMI1/KNR4 family protein [Solibacillus merdavium]